MHGLFITFEGPDGAGKTTQIKMSAEYLKQAGVEYIQTREPGGTPISDEIRALLLNPAFGEMTDEAEALLYAASRAQHVREKILPAMEAGKVVLCDRFIDASIAYQGHGLGLDIGQVKAINRFAAGNLKPDRSYLIDLPPEAARLRMINRGQADRIEQKASSYHARVRKGFLQLREEEPERICYIDGNRDKTEVFEEITRDLSGIIQKWKGENQ